MSSLVYTNLLPFVQSPIKENIKDPGHWPFGDVIIIYLPVWIYKQRVLMPGHQGWNDLHSLCRIGMEYYLLNNDNNDDDDDDDDNKNNDNNNNNNDDDDDDDDNKNNNNNVNDYNYNNDANNDNNENDNNKNSSDSMPVTV